MKLSLYALCIFTFASLLPAETLDAVLARMDKAAPSFHAMSADVTMAYQGACLGMPNRQVTPLESWQEKIRVLFMGEKKQKDAMDLVLKCTYEGSRTVNGRAIGGTVPGPITRRLTDAYVAHVGTDFVAQYLSRLA